MICSTSRPSPRGAPPRAASTLMGPIVRAAVESLRPAAEAKGVRLTTRSATASERVSGDPDRLQQVVWNLVSNAISSPDRAATSTSTSSAAGPRRDPACATPAGLEPEWLPHVFERFWQADVTTTRRHDGLGLGLSIVRHLVELHGERWRSRAPDPARVRASACAYRSRRSGPPRNARLEASCRAASRGCACWSSTTRRTLRRSPAWRSSRAASKCVPRAARAQALEILAGWTPSVLVSDIAMPDVDGYALIRHVRAREAAHGGHIPALAFTALARAEDRARVLAAGFDGHVPKPVDPLQLVDAVASAVDGTGSEASSDCPEAAPATTRVRRESMPPTTPSPH